MDIYTYILQRRERKKGRRWGRNVHRLAVGWHMKKREHNYIGIVVSCVVQVCQA